MWCWDGGYFGGFGLDDFENVRFGDLGTLPFGGLRITGCKASVGFNLCTLNPKPISREREIEAFKTYGFGFSLQGAEFKL